MKLFVIVWMKNHLSTCGKTAEVWQCQFTEFSLFTVFTPYYIVRKNRERSL